MTDEPTIDGWDRRVLSDRTVWIERRPDGVVTVAEDLPCECGCGRRGPNGMMEAIHPDDYREAP